MNIQPIQTTENRPVLYEASEQVRISGVWYQNFFELARDGMLILDADTRKIVDANLALAQLTEYAREEIMGKELWEIGVFPDATSTDTVLQEMQEARCTCSKYLPLQTKGGARRDVEMVSNLYQEDGHQIIQCSVRDMTNYNQTKEEVGATSREIISIWESMTDAFYSLDKNWRFSYVNSHAVRQLQRNREEILGALIWDAFPEAVGTALERQYKRAAAEQIQVSFEEFYVPLQAWFSIHVYPSNAGLSVYFRDITERKRADEACQQSDLQLRTLVESIPQIVWMSRPDGRELFFNQKWFDYTGLTEEERLEGGWAKSIHPDDRQLVVEAWKQSVKSGEPYEMEFRLRRTDGVYHWMLGRAVPLRDAEGQNTRWFGTATDVHDLKRAEEVMQHSEREQRVLAAQLATERARLVAAQSVAKVGSWEIDFSTKREAWSVETYRILEIEPRDFQPHEQAFLQFVHPDDREVMSQVLEASLGQSASCTQEHRLLMPDGRVKVVEQRWQIFHDEHGKPVHAIGTIQDITERKHAQQILEAKTREITTIWESMTDALLTLDLDGNITHINSQAATTLQTPPETLLGKNIWACFPDAVNTPFHEAYQRAVTGQVKVDFEAFYHPLEIWLDVHVYPSSVGVSVYFRDITERRRAQEALQRSEQGLMRAQRIAHLGYMERDLASGQQSWSDEVFRILGYEPQSLDSLSGKVSQHLHPDDRERALKAANRLFAEGTPFNIEHRIVRPSGEIRWVQAQAEAGRDEKGQIVQFSCTWLDITERKQDEEEKNRLQAEIEEQQRRIDTIVATVPGVVWETYAVPDAASQRTDFVSDYVETMVGYTVTEWLETPNFWLSIMHPDDKERAQGEMQTIFARGKGGTVQYRWHAKDGRTVWVESRIVVVWDDERQPRGLRGVTIDITERKEAEFLLKESQERLALATESAQIGVWDWDITTNRVVWDARTYELHGISGSENDGTLAFWRKSLHPEDRERTAAEVAAALAGPQEYRSEYRVVWPGGEVRHLETYGTVHRSPDGTALRMIGVNRDITEHKEAEASLRRMRDELEVRVQKRTAQLAQANEELTLRKTILESQGEASIDGILVINHEGEIMSLNRRFVEMWGIAPEVIATHSDAIVLQSVLNQLQDPKSFLTNVSYHYENRNERSQEEVRLKDGRVFDRYSAPVEGKDGSNYGRIWFFRDVTERKQFEESIRQARDEADKANVAKSEFLSRMSHELRTPLNGILGFGQILAKRNLDPLAQESVGHILKAGHHLLDLINEVLDMARVESGHIDLFIEPVGLHEIVPEVCALMKPLALERDIRLLETVSLLEAPYVLADRQRLKQVFINLLSNAIKYNHDGGEVEASCELLPNGRVTISVRDNGLGIAPSEVSKLFTPFERLQAANSTIQGTGLGLALSKQMVQAMGGSLRVDSIVGVATIFVLELAQTDPPLPSSATEIKELSDEKPNDFTQRRFTVLCIEDNSSNLALIEAILQERAEIDLLTALQGSVGIELARQHNPDLILLDLDLPDLHGSDVLVRLKQSALTRAIPVVIVSADATPVQIERLLSAGAKSYLTKPLDVREFLSTLDQLLLTTPCAGFFN